MGHILSGLSKFGLGKLENLELYDEEKKKKKEPEKVQEIIVIEKPEKDYLFDKSYVCPVCSENFKVPTLKAGRGRVIGIDKDLRPRYEGIDPIKYDVILCPRCGYAALGRYFMNITPPQIKLIKKEISRNFNPIASLHEYSYDDAFVRYQLALGSAVVKLGATSEKAYICLRMAWLVRGKQEQLDKNASNYDEEYNRCVEDEEELLKSAMEGFLEARLTEAFPICGMDEHTLDIIIAAIALRFKDYDLAVNLLSQIITSKNVNLRLKDRAIEMKNEVIELRKQADM